MSVIPEGIYVAAIRSFHTILSSSEAPYVTKIQSLYGLRNNMSTDFPHLIMTLLSSLEFQLPILIFMAEVIVNDDAIVFTPFAGNRIIPKSLSDIGHILLHCNSYDYNLTLNMLPLNWARDVLFINNTLEKLNIGDILLSNPTSFRSINAACQVCVQDMMKYVGKLWTEQSPLPGGTSWSSMLHRRSSSGISAAEIRAEALRVINRSINTAFNEGDVRILNEDDAESDSDRDEDHASERVGSSPSSLEPGSRRSSVTDGLDFYMDRRDSEEPRNHSLSMLPGE
nr:MAG: hypothetical protein [Halyomorpha halys reo-like associated virus 1]